MNPTLRRKGMTLIELLVAVTLAMMAMAAIMGFLRVLDGQRKGSLVVGNDEWHASMVETLERDLIGCRQIYRREDEVHFVGHLLDQTFARHSPAEVVLRLQKNRSDGSGWLSRSVRVLGDNGSEQTSLVCAKALRFQIERVDDRGRLQPVSEELSPAPQRLCFTLTYLTERNAVRVAKWILIAS